MSLDIFALPTHPAAEIFPMLGEEELAELAESIRENGLQEPLVLGPDPDGALWLVDGRNRREACRIAGVEPETRTLNGEDQTAFIVAANVNRRHMTRGQRAMAVAMIYPEPAKGGRGKVNPSIIEGFSHGALSEARTALRYAPDLAELVRVGDLRLNEAYGQAKVRQLASQSVTDRIADLEKRYPDLANSVREEIMRLEAAELDARNRDEAKREQAAANKKLFETGKQFLLQINNGIALMDGAAGNDWPELKESLESASKAVAVWIKTKGKDDGKKSK